MEAVGVDTISEFDSYHERLAKEVAEKSGAPVNHMTRPRRPSCSMTAPKAQPLVGKVFVLLMHILRGLAIKFSGRLVMGRDFIVLYQYLTADEQKRFLGEVKDRNVTQFSRRKMSTMTIYSIPSRLALAQKRQTDEAAGVIQANIRGRNQRVKPQPKASKSNFAELI
eukprot:FR739648.1.p1 GENE.FR739648.1~~FR739648.1.p1  ORF type:complete len:193 (+),score=22.19 FR739648.1:81-581(+)